MGGGDRFGTGRGAELAPDPPHVGADDLEGELEAVRDLADRERGGQQLEDADLSDGEGGIYRPRRGRSRQLRKLALERVDQFDEAGDQRAAERGARGFERVRGAACVARARTAPAEPQERMR